jgi:sugar phosphate isomerase/epimerase
MPTILTILSSLAGPDFEPALDRHVAWGIKNLDLHDAIYGKSVMDLTEAQAQRAAEALARRDLHVHALGTTLFQEQVEAGERVFREGHAARVEQVLRVAQILKPRRIDLRAACTERRREVASAVAYIEAQRPWLLPLYREAASAIRAAGFDAGIANHADHCILATPAEVLAFFAALDHAQIDFVFDPVDFWRMGTMPTPEACQPLAHLVGVCAVKGGLADRRSGSLCWRCGLADASWPVTPITRSVLSAGRCAAVSLKTPHGHRKLGYDYHDLAARDVQFLHAQFPELA